MSYRRFFAYNVIGAVVWVFGIVLLGHFFGNIPYVQKNFSWSFLRSSSSHDSATLEDSLGACSPALRRKCEAESGVRELAGYIVDF